MPGAQGVLDSAAVFRRLSCRLLPPLFLVSLVCQLDRANLSFAALQMREELDFFTRTIQGLGSGASPCCELPALVPAVASTSCRALGSGASPCCVQQSAVGSTSCALWQLLLLMAVLLLLWQLCPMADVACALTQTYSSALPPAGLFFIGYLSQIPANIACLALGPRCWLPIILVAWGVVAACFAAVNSTAAFLTLRLLLGVAEAGA